MCTLDTSVLRQKVDNNSAFFLATIFFFSRSGLSNGDVIAIATIFSLLFASLLGTVVTIVLFYLKHRYDQGTQSRSYKYYY